MIRCFCVAPVCINSIQFETKLDASFLAVQWASNYDAGTQLAHCWDVRVFFELFGKTFEVQCYWYQYQCIMPTMEKLGWDLQAWIARSKVYFDLRYMSWCLRHERHILSCSLVQEWNSLDLSTLTIPCPRSGLSHFEHDLFGWGSKEYEVSSSSLGPSIGSGTDSSMLHRLYYRSSRTARLS